MTSKYQYLNCSGGSHGKMQCAHCGKKISTGNYRVHVSSKNNDWGYVTMHAKCTKQDSAWKTELKKLHFIKSSSEEFIKDAEEFNKKWKVSSLQDDIDEMSNSLVRVNESIKELESEINE